MGGMFSKPATRSSKPEQKKRVAQTGIPGVSVPVIESEPALRNAAAHAATLPPPFGRVPITPASQSASSGPQYPSAAQTMVHAAGGGLKEALEAGAKGNPRDVVFRAGVAGAITAALEAHTKAKVGHEVSRHGRTELARQSDEVTRQVKNLSVPRQ